LKNKIDLEPVSEKELHNVLTKGNVRFLDVKLIQNTDTFENLWHTLEKLQDESRKLSTWQEEANIEIDTDKPILFVGLSDLHIGAIQTKYRELRNTVELLADVPNIYVGSVGDTVDNYLPSFHNEGMFNAMIPPEVQKRLVEYLYEKIGDKLLFLVNGCHDEASHNADDFDWTKYLQEKFQCVNLGFGGFINLKVGKITYRICARHKYRFNSSLNLTHTVKRMREQIGNFDIGIIGHNHQSAIELTTIAGEEKVFIRPGSFKRADRYARSLGFTSAKTCDMPTVILYPDEKRMIPQLNIENAVTVLKGIKK